MNLRSLITISLFLWTFIAKSQTTEKEIYYDDDWKKTSAEKAIVKRVIKSDPNSSEYFYVIDYFMSNGEKKMEGKYLGTDLSKKEGEFIHYYENGNKKEIVNYHNGLQSGIFEKWYENGTPKSSGEHQIIKEDRSQYTLEKISTFYDSTGTKKVEAGEGFYYEPIEGTSKFISGPISKGHKNGEWNGYDTLFNLNYTDLYNYGEFVSGKSSDKDGNTYVYYEIFKSPEPLIGLQGLYQFVGENMTYPKQARRYGIEGVVYVKFTIDENGGLKGIQTIKGIGGGCDEEAERVLKLAPFLWETGYRRGKEMNEGVLPFRFLFR